jgi:glycosyltransferase involved in cell wall biosynthesis
VRVAIVINGLGTGGAERSLAELLPALVDAGIDARVAVLHRRAEGVQESVLARGTNVHVLAATHWPGRVRELRAWLRSTAPALVHTTIFESDVCGRLAAAGTRTPVLTSLVNTSYAPARRADPNVRAWRLGLTRQVDGWTARHLTERFHAITEAVKASAVVALGIDPARITVIERGRDDARLGRRSDQRRAEVRARLGIDAGAEVVLHVGRQEFQKDHATLLRAVASLGHRPRLVTVMAGRRGNASADLDRLVAELGLGDRVRMLGHRDDVGDLLAAADVFAFPSRYEGLGGSLVEAMALSLPIVASRVDAIAETVEDDGNALLVAPGDEEALADALARVLDDTVLASRMATRSRARFEERYTIQRSNERMIALYRELGGRVGGGKQAR